MKHKLLISLVATLGLATSTSVITSQHVQAKVTRSTKHKYPIKYFNKWRTIVFNKRTTFTEILNNTAPQSMWDKYQKFQLQGRSITLPKGSRIKIKNGKFNWIIKSDLLPSPKHYYHWTSDSISDYVKYASPVVAPAAFNHKRKVKLLKNVEMVKQRQGTPLAFTRMLGFKTLKKGSIITAESGGRYAYIVWSKQLPVTNKMDFWITSEKGKWYKIID